MYQRSHRGARAHIATISFDNPQLSSHPSTTPESQECCRDIKVLGRKELRLLLSWRGKLRRFLAKKLKDESGEKAEEEEGEEEEMDRRLAEMKAEEVAELRRICLCL
ncbi:pre-rRNA 2'-O-ribose RNA methyltransferase FTSJ3-like [Conger conger]|uniref:pre-rRNA 2'-O-ribose RNA methyltransferase FTSJ3-like n=1 Tax=Conger conger TaxID=82655 RepID=UPI002A5998F9|nr:pre-rRNA 2'-O-ribose RNA methyltransferase FTSJ3-like isoform X2 [Conger conger]XP_061096504.1 pre-rRNA 2'-O-ribose RNA methyltransferase FTSJ3-like [Conger conger]